MRAIYTIMFVISLAVFVASGVIFGLYGLNLGVDFTGGSIMQIEFVDRPSTSDIVRIISQSEITHEVSVNPTGDTGVLIRSQELSEAQHQELLAVLGQAFPNSGMQETRFDSIGPAVGKELRNKSIIALVVLLVAVLIYVAFMFRKLSRSLSLWAMAAGTVLGLAHDVFIPIGLFALLGEYMGVQITAVYVAAALTIVGYTISDKVVIYDRVRENILRGVKASLADIVHMSVMQTLVRSINNTLTVMLSSFAIFLFGGESIKYFALALMVGVALGAYSSIFVASPLLVWFSKKGFSGVGVGKQFDALAKKR